MIAATSTSTGGSPRTRRRASSVALAAAVAAGLAMCAGVADGFVAPGAAPAPMRSRSGSISSSSSTAPLVPPLAAVGVETEARSSRDKLKFGNCEDSWDCEGTQSCCDFVFFKVCCSDGTAAQEQWVPVPIPVRPNDGYPGPYNGGGYYR